MCDYPEIIPVNVTRQKGPHPLSSWKNGPDLFSRTVAIHHPPRECIESDRI